MLGGAGAVPLEVSLGDAPGRGAGLTRRPRALARDSPRSARDQHPVQPANPGKKAARSQLH